MLSGLAEKLCWPLLVQWVRTTHFLVLWVEREAMNTASLAGSFHPGHPVLASALGREKLGEGVCTELSGKGGSKGPEGSRRL